MTFEQYEITRRAVLQEVTALHLDHTYTCVASNSVGNSSVTVQLKKMIQVKWPSLVHYPIASLLLVAGLGIVLQVKWLEIKLLYRCYCQHGKLHGEEKDYDVFLSYVWSSPTAEVNGGLTPSCPPGPNSNLEACLSSVELLSSEEGRKNQRPLEVLLLQVLEDLWGYRLCLQDRDMLPGGAYTNDVVKAIQRSQMLICLLSADYLSDSRAVFTLESGIQALLQNSPIRLLLIWTRAPTSVTQPDSLPLPSVVQRALKVLPSLDWTSRKPGQDTSTFWRSLRKALPTDRVKSLSHVQIQETDHP
ncbi:interleukin-18 receptor accessory protein-like [Aulostomus maculatus]